MGYLDVLNSINKVTDITGNGINALSNIFGSSDTSPKSIKDKYLNGFVGETTQFTPNVFARIFDEPTYLSFRIVFEKGETNENNVLGDGKIYGTAYDNLPEPLLAAANGSKNYSSVYYLRNVLGEHKRAQLLETFIASLFDIQKNYPYYFQSIEGLNNLLNTKPASGIRVDPENNIITISCLEGLDLKITQLLQLYRKCAWDDVYQRWILPDMMRYFNMKIYISEIRLFHSMSKSVSQYNKSFMYELSKGEIRNATSRDKLKSANALETAANFLNAVGAVSTNFLGSKSVVSKALNYTNATISTVENIKQNVSNNVLRLCNNAINEVMPTICIDCHMCEFVIDDNFENISTLYAYRSEPTTAKIKIKVNKVFEKHVYPLNNTLTVSSSDTYNVSTDMYIDDYKLMKDDNLERNREVTGNVDKTELISAFRMSDAISNADFGNAGSKDLSYRISYNDSEDTLKALTMQLLNTFINTPSSKATNNNVQPISNVENNRNSADNNFNYQDYEIELPKSSEKLNTNSISFETEEIPAPSAKLVNNDDNDILNNFPNKRNANDASALISTAAGKNINEAIEVLNELKSFIENNDDIKSMAVSDEQRKMIQSSLFESVLIEISKSKATSDNVALIELAKSLLSEINKSNVISKATNNNSAFENLNN